MVLQYSSVDNPIFVVQDVSRMVFKGGILGGTSIFGEIPT